ncbi:hypothetical protein Gorai_017501, partial [Gossypium raimondii]|nr:hypothetical protein [Gossypium raimondii]
GTGIGIKPTPVVASFSGRGPNWLNPEILKPKLIAPRVNILAAWTSVVGQTGGTPQLVSGGYSISYDDYRKTFIRTTTDVGEANSIYIANIVAPTGVTVRVEQAKLVFTPTVKKRSFLVIVTADSKHLVVDDVGAVFGSLSKIYGNKQ